MVAPRRITRRQLAHDPHAVWNIYVNILATSVYHALSQAQRHAHLVFWYESEGQNGGHCQYFENQGIERVDEVIAALKHLGALGQADVLCLALAKFAANPREKIESVDEFVDACLEGEFDADDRAFHKCEPPLVRTLQAFLDRNVSEFVVIAD